MSAGKDIKQKFTQLGMYLYPILQLHVQWNPHTHHTLLTLQQVTFWPENHFHVMVNDINRLIKIAVSIES